MMQMRVFLSYAPADSTIAAAVVTALQRVGVDVWFDERAQGMSQPLDEIIHQLYISRLTLKLRCLSACCTPSRSFPLTEHLSRRRKSLMNQWTIC